MTDKPDPDDHERPLTLRETFGSIVAAAIGVQSNKNRERDFRRGSARNYIVLGLVATLLFILTVYGAVKLILGLAGA
ncbi:MAG: DUF2970 domain-containing protein [Gammaproteobacteria bacterium]|nr:DUF2970 domain-containing protein [Gammaproteobacteria bacterium]MCP5200729.1 DUF2970 domain-containing protein [Gammaproteobacteria bacterium]